MAAKIFFGLPFFFLKITALETGASVVQTPNFKLVKRGESVSISCEITLTNGKLEGTYFRKGATKGKDLCFISAQNEHIDQSYQNRLKCNKTKADAKKINIMLSNLQENDTDVYYCETGVSHSRISESFGRGTFIMVSDLSKGSCKDHCVKEEKCKLFSFKDPLLITVIILVVVGLLSVLVLLLWNVRKFNQQKQSPRRRAPNSVYEDMTLVRTQSMAR